MQVLLACGLLGSLIWLSTDVFASLGSQPPWWFGAVERVNGHGLMRWAMVLAVVLLRSQPRSSARREGSGPVEPRAAPDRP